MRRLLWVLAGLLLGGVIFAQTTPILLSLSQTAPAIAQQSKAYNVVFDYTQLLGSEADSFSLSVDGQVRANLSAAVALVGGVVTFPTVSFAKGLHQVQFTATNTAGSTLSPLYYLDARPGKPRVPGDNARLVTP